MITAPRPLGIGTLVVVLLYALGCSNMSTYTANRLSDLTDVAHVDMTHSSVGLVVNVGPMLLGAEGLLPDSDHGSHQYRLGLGGPLVLVLDGASVGLVWPFQCEEVNARRYGGLAKGYDEMGDDCYWKHVPAWGSIGISGGFLVGVGAHVDLVELADFILGFFGYDIVDDDLSPTSPYSYARTSQPLP